jgi:hypothetical protein
MNLTGQPVTVRACARPAPGRPASYACVGCHRTMRTFLLLSLITGLLFPSASSAQADFERMHQIDEFVWEAGRFLDGKSIKQISSLGIVLEEKIEHEPNPHNSSITDEFRKIRFEGLETYGWMRTPEEYSPIYIRISSSGWKLPKYLTVGVASDKVYDTLGQPNKKDDDKLEYWGETEHVTFHLDAGRVIRISLDYYLD